MGKRDGEKEKASGVKIPHGVLEDERMWGDVMIDECVHSVPHTRPECYEV
jgi:hypothetical protein